MGQLENLKNRVFGKKRSVTETKLTGMMEMARGFGCIGEIIGRDYEILDKSGNVIYTIRQKPMKVKQMRSLVKEFIVLKRLDHEYEVAKMGGNKKSRVSGKRRR